MNALEFLQQRCGATYEAKIIFYNLDADEILEEMENYAEFVLKNRKAKKIIDDERKKSELAIAYGKNWEIFKDITSFNGWVKRKKANYKLYYSRDEVDLSRDGAAFRIKTLSHLTNPATEKLKKKQVLNK